MDIEKCLLDMKKAVKKAGATALDMRENIKDIGKLDKQFNDENPILHDNKTALTMADLECQKIIMKVLLESFNFCGVYAEENNDEIANLASQFSHSGKLKKDKYTFLIDPIDGTRNYIEKNSINSDKYGIFISLAYGFE